ncbi:receptor-type adenylate cyclase, putative [Leishmania guyanensis]
MYIRPLHSGCRRCGGACDHAARLASQWRTAALLVTAAFTSVLLFSPPWVRAGITNAADLEPVYLLNTMYATDAFVEDDAKALWKGMDMAFYNSGYKAAGGRPIKILHPDPVQDSLNDTAAVILRALHRQEKLLAVLGPYMDTCLTAALNSVDVVKSELMLLGPFTGSSTVRTWSDSVYFTRAEPMIELKVVMMHVINTIRARRVAFMHLTGAHFGEEELLYMQLTLASLLRDPAAVYAAPLSVINAEVDQHAFDAMADTHPQVIIVWTAPGKQVARFLEKALTDSRTSSAYIISCSMMQRLMFHVHKRLLNSGSIVSRDGQILVSATGSPVSDQISKYIKVFKAQMRNYIENSGSFDYSPDDETVETLAPTLRSAMPRTRNFTVETFLEAHPDLAQLMVLGWLSGTLVQQTLERPDWIVSRSAYKAGLFNQNRFMIGGDYVLGDYGGSCEPLAQYLGATCYCNQGGRSAILTVLKDASWDILPDSLFTYPQSACNSSKAEVIKAATVLILMHLDSPKLMEAGVQMTAIAPDAVQDDSCKRQSVNRLSLSMTMAAAQRLFDAEVGNYSVDIVAGPMLRTLDVGNTFVVSPLYNRPHLLTKKRNYVYLMPTLEQQMFLLYFKIDAVRAAVSAGTDTRVTLRGYSADEADAISDLLCKTAGTFNLPDPFIIRVPLTESLTGIVAPKGINVVVGMTDGDGSRMATFLAANPAAIIVVCFDDLAMHYTELIAALSIQPSSVQSRLISFNSLPLWSDTSPAAEADSPVLKLFHRRFPDPHNHTPSLLRDLVTASFIGELIAKVGVPHKQLLAGELYMRSTFTTHNMVFGPFEWGCTTTASGDDCIYENYGARSIVMLSVQRMLDPRVPPLTAPMTPSLVYRPRVASSALTPAERNGIIAGVVLLVVASIAAVGLLLYCCMDNRDNDAAPKDGDEPVTLVFTDIESSTALWAVLPQLMADAIVAHHRVIRQLIVKHGCYEVKTVGDSFMIACKSAHSAVRLACEIQTKLLGHDWGTVSIDAAYREFELARADADDDYVPPTARLSEEEYAAVWCGLRVRVGVHTGLCDIRYDEVTKGYDYYGDTPNMAARTEAIANGGQVVATETAWWALSNEERAGAAHTAMGRQGLRGVPFAVEMFQVDAVPGRRHAALRTEIEAILPDETATETASSAAGALLSSVGTMSGPAAGIALVLTSCFAPYPVAQRVRELQPLLSKWGVGAPPRSRAVSEEDYCQGLMNRLALRIATVSQARQRMGKGGAVVAGDMPDVDAGGALNPLVGGGGCGVGGAAPRPSGMTAPPRSEEPSAMREWLALNCLKSDTQVSLMDSLSLRRASCVRSSIGLMDTVVPFSAHTSGGSNAENSGGDDEVATICITLGAPYARHVCDGASEEVSQ